MEEEVVLYEVPQMSQFTFIGDGYMKCDLCEEEMQPATLMDAVELWNEHTCSVRRA